MTVSDEDDGIIIPPPEIKTACDKTAQVVAKHGQGFEDRLRDKEQQNTKFCFLNPNDPYHRYYQKQIKLSKSGAVPAASKPPPPSGPPGSASNFNNEQSNQSNGSLNLPPAGPPVPQERIIPTAPEPNEFLGEIPSLSKLDFDIVKLTAQFVARNGTRFMTALSQREQKNYQFDFMRPSHSLYPFFTKLVEQYTKILVPPRNLFSVLESNATDRYQILESVMRKVEYRAYELEEKERARQEADAEKIAFATIDWHDFVVVETIEFLEADNKAVLPPPTSILELQSMTLEQRKALLSFDNGPAEDEEDDMEMDDDMDMDEDVPAVAPAKPLIIPSASTATTGSGTKYVPKVGRHAKSEATQICVICKATIKMSEMAEHVRVELLDPRYREKREALQAKERESNLVQGDLVAENLKKMSNFRSDIFGSGRAGEATLSQKLEFEAEKQKQAAKSKVIWDGTVGSVPLAQAKMQSIAEQQKAKPAQPPPPPVPITGPIRPPPGKPQPPPPPPSSASAGPEVKRVKLSANANALALTVNLASGEPISFTDLTPLWTVSQLKERLAPLCGMVAGKQKLVTASGTVLKNAFSLHDSGVRDGDVITLQTKERSKK